jgi:hypothetical protein
VIRERAGLTASASPAYFCLLSPSSMKRLINSETPMPVRLERLCSFATCTDASQIVVRFMVGVCAIDIPLSSEKIPAETGPQPGGNYQLRHGFILRIRKKSCRGKRSGIASRRK